MTGPHLSAAQLRNRLILTARWIVADHWPRSDDRCPICRVPNCEVITVARDYLDAIKDRYVPPHVRRRP